MNSSSWAPLTSLLQRDAILKNFSYNSGSGHHDVKFSVHLALKQLEITLFSCVFFLQVRSVSEVFSQGGTILSNF